MTGETVTDPGELREQLAEVARTGIATEADEPAWVTYDQVIAIHSRQLRRFGGAPGLRGDGGGLST